MSIFLSGVDLRTIIPSGWATGQKAKVSKHAGRAAPPANILGGLGKQVNSNSIQLWNPARFCGITKKKIMDKRNKLQVGQLENRMSVISEQEEAAQKRLIAAEDALRNEASSHTASTALNVTLPPQLFFLMGKKVNGAATAGATA